MTRPKIFHPGEIEQGMTIPIAGVELRYLRQVLRLKTEDGITILDGKNSAFPGIIKIMGPEVAMVEITGRADSPGIHLDITLAQALVKGNHMDFLVEKAAELGAGRIIPFRSARVIPRLEGEKARAKVERWQKIAREAARQVGRGSFPRIEAVAHFSEMLTQIPVDALRLIFWEEERRQGIREVLPTPSHDQTPRIAVVIGPEGGFTQEEIAEATSQGFISVSLGRQVFKVETALMVIMAIIQYEMGFLGGPEYVGPVKTPFSPPLVGGD